MTPIDKFLNSENLYLTDGGFETWLFFVDGFEAPEFAAITLMEDEKARLAMWRYFERFLEIAEYAGRGFVLDTNSWRGCVSWADKLELSRQDLLALSGEAVAFAKDIRAAWQGRVEPILINAVVGPSGDGYKPGDTPTAEEAYKLHMPQLEVFAAHQVDMVSALTITNIGEAVGIVRAAKERELPVVISFTVETDGRLTTGETLAEAIALVDEYTDSGPLYYMVNCAHPEHFRGALQTDAGWVNRIGGIRANASRLSHAELDDAETLDDGNPEEFGSLYKELSELLPNLKVVGGCCGTDHRHVGCASRRLTSSKAA
ncbi:MAG: homocysteine S-methyltransferase [Rhodomicrobium sp.]|nr:MAG: homocysteine S-methyltransferase [Rhodomicrobium sp.]